MPTGIYKRTKETREKMRQSHLGKGHPHTEATKKKIRQLHLGKKLSEVTKEKIRQALLGKPSGMLGKEQSETAKEKMRQSHLGKKHTKATKEKIRQANLGHIVTKETKEKIREANSGEKSENWKGDNVSYSGMHIWVRQHKGKASLHKCIDCEEQAREWSNVDHTYKRNLKDYKPRCIKCHKKYDKESNLIIKK